MYGSRGTDSRLPRVTGQRSPARITGRVRGRCFSCAKAGSSVESFAPFVTRRSKKQEERVRVAMKVSKIAAITLLISPSAGHKTHNVRAWETRDTVRPDTSHN